MPSETHGIVLFGDVVDSRSDPGASAFLRSLRAELEAAYPPGARLAPFGFTQGDELQGLLALDADPFVAIVRAGLRHDARAMRWAVVVGSIDAGRGPATERTGPAFHAARDLLARAKGQRDGLLVLTGDVATDALLDDLAPLLSAMLDDLTARQREVGRLLLVDGLRRIDAAERLGISRATVSVIAERGRLRRVAGLARALTAALRAGMRAAGTAGTATTTTTVPGSVA